MYAVLIHRIFLVAILRKYRYKQKLSPHTEKVGIDGRGKYELFLTHAITTCSIRQYS